MELEGPLHKLEYEDTDYVSLLLRTRDYRKMTAYASHVPVLRLLVRDTLHV